MSEIRRWKFNLWGWMLFVVSSGFFIWTSLRSGDMIGLFGGLFFFVACIVFIIPLAADKPD